MNFEQIKHNIALFSMFNVFFNDEKKLSEKIVEIVEINEINWVFYEFV